MPLNSNYNPYACEEVLRRARAGRLYEAVSINVMDCMCEYVFVYALTHSRRIPAALPCSPSLINQPQCQFIHSGAACGHSCVLWMPDGLLRQIFEGRKPPPPLRPPSVCSGPTATQLQFHPTLPCKMQQFIKSLAEQARHLVWFDIWFIISLKKKKKAHAFDVYCIKSHF